MAFVLLTFRLGSTSLGKDGNQEYKGQHSCHAVQPGQLSSPWTSKSLAFRRCGTSHPFKDPFPSLVCLVYVLISSTFYIDVPCLTSNITKMSP